MSLLLALRGFHDNQSRPWVSKPGFCFEGKSEFLRKVEIYCVRKKFPLYTISLSQTFCVHKKYYIVAFTFDYILPFLYNIFVKNSLIYVIF